MNVYPDNTTAQYRTKLPQVIDLEGDWLVCLREIGVSGDYYNVRSDQCYMEVHKSDAEGYRQDIRRIVVPRGNYKSLRELTTALNLLTTDDYNIVFNTSVQRDRVRVDNHGEWHMRLSEDLARMVGHTPRMSYFNGNFYSDIPIDLSTREDFRALYVYCDVVEPIVVGDTKAPLLRIIDTSAGKEHQILNPPLYVPLLKKHFDTISIHIMLDTGEPAPFAGDIKSFVVLEFKRAGIDI